MERRKEEKEGKEDGREGMKEGGNREKEQNVKWLPLSLPQAVKNEGCGELGRKMPWIRDNYSRGL